MAFDAYEVKEQKIEVKKNSFRDREGELSGEADAVLNQTQKLLDQMEKTMKKDLNKEELKLAKHAIETKLEKAMPDDFKDYYNSSKDVGGWSRAVDLITTDVLQSVQNIITYDLKKIIKTVDAESWTASLDPSEIKDVLVALDIAPADINRILNHMIQKSENLLAEGKKAVGGGYHAKIAEELRKAGAQ